LWVELPLRRPPLPREKKTTMKSLLLLALVCLSGVLGRDGANLNPYNDLDEMQSAPPAPAAPALLVETDASLKAQAKAPTIVVGGGLQTARVPENQPALKLEDEDPEMAKLKAALEAVKEDIVANSKQISDERKWVSAVRKIVLSYEDKMKRVNDHILALRKEQKVLFDKKKQIENLRLQRRLTAKLKKASEELKTLQYSLDHVQQKSHELNAEHANLQSTIAKIESQLIKLKGGKKKKALPLHHKKKHGGDKGDIKADKKKI